MNNFDPNWYLFGVAGLSLLIGLILLWILNSKNFANPLSVSLICWLFIAMFPVFMIFAFFPSDVKGEMLGFTLTGAFAGYVFIWWFGSGKYIDAHNKDELNTKIRDLEGQLARALIISKPDRIKLPDGETVIYKLEKDRTKKIILITGNITAIKNIDVWVNSENTHMQMPGYFDRSVSGAIRYCGAKKDAGGKVTDDTINNELIAELIKQGVITKFGENVTVMPATVFVTGAGELENSNNVKKIFHVASVQGTAGHGYSPVKNIADCVRNALDKAKGLPKPKPQSILFPLLGTGQGSGELKPIVQLLMDTTISYLENTTDSSITSVYFATLFDDQLAVCREVLEAHRSRGVLTT